MTKREDKAIALHFHKPFRFCTTQISCCRTQLLHITSVSALYMQMAQLVYDCTEGGKNPLYSPLRKNCISSEVWHKVLKFVSVWTRHKAWNICTSLNQQMTRNSAHLSERNEKIKAKSAIAEVLQSNTANSGIFYLSICVLVSTGLFPEQNFNNHISGNFLLINSSPPCFTFAEGSRSHVQEEMYILPTQSAVNFCFPKYSRCRS